MPQIKFTDTNLKTLSADSTTWFSDPTCKGLQLCVTAGGVKTWYVNKWDSRAQKTRRVKLGQWSAQGKHTAWAKKQVGKTAHDIDEGTVKTRQEREAEAASKAVPPTLREAFELEAASRLGLDDAFGGPRAEETVQNYRSVLERKLDGLLDTRVDEIDHGEIQRRLDALTKSAPFAAHKLHIALSYARTQALSALNIEHTRDGSKVTCSKNLLLENLATQIENGTCIIAHDLPGRDQLLQEIAAFELTFTSAGNPVLQGGGKGHHSDTAIAAALALLGETHLSSRAMEVRRLQGFF